MQEDETAEEDFFFTWSDEWHRVVDRKAQIF
jgi:hypothetical protein